MQHIIQLLSQYGYIVLLLALMLELIAFPLPGELLMTYCGFLVYQNKLNWGMSVVFSFLGASLGITISYVLGNLLGIAFFEKYGRYFSFHHDRFDKLSVWFNRYGNKLLVVAYFIPGVRHITGYFSGITRLSYKKFALNAYIGAAIWCLSFISIGTILGPKWELYHDRAKKYLFIAGLLAAVVIVVIYLYKKYRSIILNWIINMFNTCFKFFHSIRKVKIAIVAGLIIFFTFLAFVVAIIHNFLGNETGEFDDIISYMVKRVFDSKWHLIMSISRIFSSLPVLLCIVLITAAVLLVRFKKITLDIKFIFISFIGGEILAILLAKIFWKLYSLDIIWIKGYEYEFPSIDTFTAIVVYGFIAYLCLRYIKNRYIIGGLSAALLIILLFSSLNEIYFNIQKPSYLFAGYAFGGTWLIFNLILLEVYRVLWKNKD